MAIDPQSVPAVALNDGTVDTIGSDHAPHAREKKMLPWPNCASGLTGVQTLVPIMLNHVNNGRLSLSRMVDLMCAGPARVYGALGKGRLAADPVFHIAGIPEEAVPPVKDAVARATGGKRFNGEDLQESVRIAARRAAKIAGFLSFTSLLRLITSACCS